MALTLQDIEQLFLERGHRSYDGESVSHLRHALQTAALAERHHAGPELITACLLHDLGHLIADRPGTPTLRGLDDKHQYFVLPFLRGLFGPGVLEPIRLHVEAKRYLCYLEPHYEASLSEDSKRSLALQGQLRCGPGAGFRQPAGRAGCDSAETLGRHGQGAGADHALAGALPGDRRERVDAGEAGGDPLENRACLAPGRRRRSARPAGRSKSQGIALAFLLPAGKDRRPALRPRRPWPPDATGRCTTRSTSPDTGANRTGRRFPWTADCGRR